MTKLVVSMVCGENMWQNIMLCKIIRVSLPRFSEFDIYICIFSIYFCGFSLSILERQCSRKCQYWYQMCRNVFFEYGNNMLL